jgi:hypothetical protein
MTVYEKLIEARVRFQAMNIKKSGENKFAKYTYYELADILPAVNSIAKELKFACVVNYTPELATLDFVDAESPGKVTFTSPMATADLKGCHAVQNLGAAETYLRRYLYQQAFEIVEADALDGTINPNQKPEQNSVKSQNTQKNAPITPANGNHIPDDDGQQPIRDGIIKAIGEIVMKKDNAGKGFFTPDEAEAAREDIRKAKSTEDLRAVLRAWDDLRIEREEPIF